MLALVASVSIQAEDSLPLYLPGDGVYIVGIDPATRQTPLDEPTMVAEAYRMSFHIQNVDVAAAKAGGKTYNLAKYFSEDETLLDISAFMGVGTASDLVVRDMEGNKYQLGQYAESAVKPARLLAAYDTWRGHATLPLGVYDHWDCPVTYDEDPLIKAGADTLTVDFGDPHEGLVMNAISFNLCSSSSVETLCASVSVNMTIYTETPWSTDIRLQPSYIEQVAEGIYAVKLPLKYPIARSRFTVTVSGLHTANAWLPRAVDTHALYPTHTTYEGGMQDAAADVCLNVEGYFNYIGTWGLLNGKEERGEVVSEADYVQVYYDPTDEDWPGNFFMGEAAFPVECTFGASDIVLSYSPDWIVDFLIDASQWDEYGAIQLAIVADALPEGETKRVGYVIFSTADGASHYRILIRQGAGWFDEIEYGAEGVDQVIIIPEQGGMFDLMGRSVSEPVRGQIYIQNGKKIMY